MRTTNILFMFIGSTDKDNCAGWYELGSVLYVSAMKY